MQENFLQAACRHLKSADILEKSGMLDESVYLSGYVVECTYKAIVETYITQKGARAYQHKISAFEEKGINRLRVLFPKTDTKLPSSRTDGTILTIFHPERRYAANGLWDKEKAVAANNRAREIFYETIGDLVLDGIISRKELD